MALAFKGMEKAIDEYGEIRVTSDKEKFERAKIGLEENIGPYNVLHVKDFNDKNSEVEGAGEMLDFIPDDNPLKIYYRENFEDEENTKE